MEEQPRWSDSLISGAVTASFHIMGIGCIIDLWQKSLSGSVIPMFGLLVLFGHIAGLNCHQDTGRAAFIGMLIGIIYSVDGYIFRDALVSDLWIQGGTLFGIATIAVVLREYIRTRAKNNS